MAHIAVFSWAVEQVACAVCVQWVADLAMQGTPSCWSRASVLMMCLPGLFYPKMLLVGSEAAAVLCLSEL
jgi:hypothetical protein